MRDAASESQRDNHGGAARRAERDGCGGAASTREAREGCDSFVLNGDARPLPADARLATLLDTLALRAEWVLVELNGEPVPRDQYDAVTLRAGDRLELVTPLAGG